MPCDGVAVASGRVDLKLAELLPSEDVLEEAVLTLLKNKYSHLGEARVQPLYYRHQGGRAAGISLVVGDRYLVNINEGRVTVNTRGYATGDDADIVEELKTILTGLLAGLAGMAFQQQVVEKMKAAGVAVTGETRAPNGAVVVNVEI